MGLRGGSSIIRWVKYGVGLSVVGGFVVNLKHSDWKVQSTGIVRFGRAAVAVTATVIDYKYTFYGLDASSPLYEKIKSEVHTRSALRLRRMCSLNGGCFVKVGQHIGALEYLLPKEYVDVMKVFHSHAPESPVKDVYRVIKEDFKKDVSDLFASFDETVLASASLAQVHCATLKDGTPVAVKVQHPNVQMHSFVDMATMDILVRLVAAIFPEFQFGWLAEETRKNIPLELDFVHEGKNCEQVSKMFGHLSFLKVPKIYWERTTKRVLTMEYFDGGFVNDVQYIRSNDISVSDVVRKLGRLYSEMIFVRGYIHCDPHPGNILVKKTEQGTQIILLDHGLYQTLSDDVRLNYCYFWWSILRADIEGIKTHAQSLGIYKLFPLFACIVTGRSWHAVSTGVDRLSFTQQEGDAIKSQAGAYVPQIIKVLNDIPRQVLLILKTNDLLRGIEATLNCRADAKSFLTMSRCCINALSDHRAKECKTGMCRWKILVEKNWSLWKVSVYEFYLWITELSLVRILSKALKPVQSYNPEKSIGTVLQGT